MRFLRTCATVARAGRAPRSMAPPKLAPAELVYEDPSVRVLWKPSGECWLQRERAGRTAYADAVAARAKQEGAKGSARADDDGGASLPPPPPPPLLPVPPPPPPTALDFGLSKVT